MKDYHHCFKTCWFWDLQIKLLFHDVKTQKRIIAVQKTYGIWSHLPECFDAY